MKKQLNNILVGSLFLILPFTYLHADDGRSDVSFFSENNVTTTNPGGHDSGDDPVDAAPIDSYTVILLLVAGCVGFYGRNNLVKIVKR